MVRTGTWYERPVLVPGCARPSTVSGWDKGAIADLAGRIDSYYIAVAWFAGLGIGGIINKLTLGDGGC